MNIYIPTGVFYALAVYYIIGLFLYIPLVHWSTKFISPRRTGLAVWKDINFKRVLTGLFLASGLCWPYIVFDCVRSERRRLTRR